MTTRLSPTVVLPATEVTALSAHRVNAAVYHGQVRAVSAAIDVKAVAPGAAINLGGLVGEHFCLKSIIFTINANAGGALNGDVQVTVGTTAGGTQLMAAVPLTGLIALNSTFRLNFTGAEVLMLGNSDVFVNVTTADTSAGGITGTMLAYVCGDTF